MIDVDDMLLVARAKSGDSDAFGQLVARHAESVKGFCYYRTGNFEEARDLCQEAFVIAYTKLHQLREDSKFGAWIRRIAQSCCNRWARSRREIPMEELVIPAPSPDSPAVELVRDALLTLPDAERLAVVLHYVDGLSYGEMADFLETSENAVRGRLYRGRKMLKREMTIMTREVFNQHKLEDDFVIKTVDLARSFTRRGMGWSPDGKHIMFLRHFEGKRGIQLWISDAQGADAQPVGELGWTNYWAWSRDSKKLAYAWTPNMEPDTVGTLHVFDVERGEDHLLDSNFTWATWRPVDDSMDTMNGWNAIVWSPDSTQFAMLYARAPGKSPFSDAIICDVETGEWKGINPEARTTGYMYPGDWSPDGSLFAFHSGLSEGIPWQIYICDRHGNDKHAITPEDWFINSDPRFRPTTGQIAFSTTHGRPGEDHVNHRSDLWMIDADGSNARCVASGASQGVSFLNPEWTSDGRYLVCLSVKVDAAGRDCQGVYVVDADSSEIINVLESDPNSDQRLVGFRNQISICSNGKRIAVTVAQYDVDDRSKKVPIYTNRRDILYYYDIPTRTLHEAIRSSPEQDGILLFGPGYNWMPLWSPDGNRILFTKGVSLDQSSWKQPLSPQGRLPYALGSIWDVCQPDTDTHMCFFEIK